VTLRQLVADALARPLPAAVTEAAERLAGIEPKAMAILFYGSNLRSGTLDGVLDFYVLTGGVGERGLWPRVGYHEVAVADGRVARIKVATVTLEMFARAAAGRTLDTTVWARFVQPAAIAWIADAEAGTAVRAAVRDAAITAARFAALLGPERGSPADYWRALFRNTYRTELRVEAPGREDAILAHDPAWYDALLPLAWDAGGVSYRADAGALTPVMASVERSRLVAAWSLRRRAGRPLNALRLIRAAFTFDGAARYGLWKVERHTGVRVALTPWRERHPILAAPGVLWRVWRARGRVRAG